MSDNREALINQLAASMGAGDFGKTKYEEARYDSESGTLYCNGYIISHNVIEDAIRHFKSVQGKCNMNDPASRHMAMVYETAIQAIKMMDKEQNEKAKELIKKNKHGK